MAQKGSSAPLLLCGQKRSRSGRALARRKLGEEMKSKIRGYFYPFLLERIGSTNFHELNRLVRPFKTGDDNSEGGLLCLLHTRRTGGINVTLCALYTYLIIIMRLCWVSLK